MEARADGTAALRDFPLKPATRLKATNELNAFLPRSHPLREASMPSTQRRTAAQLKKAAPEHGHQTRVQKKKRERPVTKLAISMDISASGLKQGASKRRGRLRKDTTQNEGDTSARSETEESTQKQRTDDEGTETVTTMVNYVAATTRWNSANGRDGQGN